MQLLHGALEGKQKEAPDADCRLLQQKGSQADETTNWQSVLKHY